MPNDRELKLGTKARRKSGKIVDTPPPSRENTQWKVKKTSETTPRRTTVPYDCVYVPLGLLRGNVGKKLVWDNRKNEMIYESEAN